MMIKQRPGFCIADPDLLRAVADMVPEVIKFLLVMGLCNTVVPIKRYGYTFSEFSVDFVIEGFTFSSWVCSPSHNCSL